MITRRTYLSILIAIVAAFAFVSDARAVGYTVLYEAGNAHGEYEGFRGYATTGAEMAGMRVTVTFDDASTETAVWKDLGGTSGGAFGSSWSLTVDADTNGPGGSWALSVDAGSPIDIVEIEAFPGNTGFDVNATTPNTAESGAGGVFAPIGADASIAAVATYWDLVSFIPDTSPVGDIYSRIVIEFSASFSGTYEFAADTDTIQVGNIGERRDARHSVGVLRR